MQALLYADSSLAFVKLAFSLVRIYAKQGLRTFLTLTRVYILDVDVLPSI